VKRECPVRALLRARYASAAAMAERAGDLLRVDEERTIEALVGRVRVIRAAAGRSGSGPESPDAAVSATSSPAAADESRGGPTAIMGLSGGLDSAVLAAIVVRALSPEHVRLAYLFDHTSSAKGRANARAVAAQLGVPLEEASIEGEMHAAGVYGSSVARLTSVSSAVNRVLYALYPLFMGEPSFVGALRAGEAEARGDRAPSVVHRRFVAPAHAGFAARHIRRRRLLEAEVARDGCFLLGAANRSEWLTGWYIKGGVDDLPDQPLIGLYKTQVRQLAGALGTVEGVRRATPSPDMMSGVTDEMGLGLPYGTIDIGLDFLSGGVTKEQAIAAGLTVRDVAGIERLLRLSAWKREPGDDAPAADLPVPASPGDLSTMPPLPVDGGPRGGLRRLP